MREEIDE
ncbi:Protein of unknown function [Bacillus cereus]|nr:Protein of unknown function [Bacillus cereus]